MELIQNNSNNFEYIFRNESKGGTKRSYINLDLSVFNPEMSLEMLGFLGEIMPYVAVLFSGCRNECFLEA